MALVLSVPQAPALSGLIDFPMGPLMGWMGYRTGKVVELAAAER